MAALQETADRIQEQVGGETNDSVVGYFLRERVYSDELSAAAGEPVYIQQDFCLQRVPGRVGEPVKQLVRKVFPDGREIVVSEWHLRKYPRAWDAFLRGEDLRPAGMLLQDCPDIPKGRIAALKAAAIRTVEELAEIPDASLRRIGHDGMVLRDVAKRVIAERNNAANLADRVQELEQKLKEAQNGDGGGTATRRRGRPRNQASE
jgi:hypothetical protein